MRSLHNQGTFLYMNDFWSAFRISGRVYNRMYFVFKGKWTYNCGGGGVLISVGAQKRQFTVGIALGSPFIDVCCNLLKILGFWWVAEVV